MMPTVHTTITTIIAAVISMGPVQLTRWSGEDPLIGDLESVGLQGVYVRTPESPIPRLIPWYDVRQTQPRDPSLDAWNDRALTAWRAHTRAARGDLPGALPLYESMRDAYLWQRGDQSMDVCSGLVRCLLDAGRRGEAIEPAIAWFIAAQLHTPDQPVADPEIDSQTLLVIGLPPVFRSIQANVRFELPDTDALTDRERLLMAMFTLAIDRGYESANRIEEIEGFSRTLRVRDPGLVLMEQMVYAQAHPDESKRQGARDALARRTRTQDGTWIEVWARLGLGASCLQDDNPLVNERGVIELIHVVVRLHHIDPRLTLLAAEMANDYLVSTARPHWGAQLLQDARAYLTGSATPPIAQETNDDD